MNKGRRYAVLIGSSRFDKEPNLNPLRCPENDVDGMREVLAAEDLGAFEEPSVFKNADSSTVMHRIEETLTEATGADQVLIYYSGHGKTDLPGRLYLATADTEVKKLVTTSIPIETLRLLIELSSCRKIMLILDCCFAGAVGRSFTKGSVDEKLQELARGNGVYILTASTASQTAQEQEGDDYGLLTKHIISGIKQGAAANNRGQVSMDDLYRYVYAKVTSEGYQEPMRWALNVRGEDLIIAHASGVSIREQQRLLTDKIIEIRSGLPSRIFTKAIQVIEDRRGPFYEIVSRLRLEEWEVGRFIEEWDQVEAGEQLQPLASAQTQERQEEAPKAEVVRRASQPEAQSHKTQSGASAPQPSPPPPASQEIWDAVKELLPEKPVSPPPQPGVHPERGNIMATGKVKWFNDAKSFDFIPTDDEDERDVFCHHSAVKADGFRTLSEGQKVDFDVTLGPKGLRAKNIIEGKAFDVGSESPNSVSGHQRALSVFLCHSSHDKETVRKLYFSLREEGIDPWLDEESLIAGQDWDLEISKAVRNSDVIVVCLSHASITKAGYVQKEIKKALDVADEQPKGTIFIIPLKLEDCSVPDQLGQWHWVNFFEKRGYEDLMKALRDRAEQLSISIAPDI